MSIENQMNGADEAAHTIASETTAKAIDFY